jgi:hypothetical protein
VDISAPGYPVLSTVDIDDSDDGSWYEYMSGTSMACPHVAGGLALAKSYYPGATTDEVKLCLMLDIVADFHVIFLLSLSKKVSILHNAK